MSTLKHILLLCGTILLVQNLYSTNPLPSDSGSVVHIHDIYNSGPFFFLGGQDFIGRLVYTYDMRQPTRHVSYAVDYNGGGIEAGGGYRWGNVGVFLAGGFHYLNYWSATHSVTKYININGVATKYIDGIATEHGYPDFLLFGSAGAEYRIQLTTGLHIAPFLLAKMWRYNDNRFYPVAKKLEESYPLTDNYAAGGGLALIGHLDDNSALSLKVSFLKANFNPEGFFNALQAENLSLSNHLMEITLSYLFDFRGYSIGFFNHQFNFHQRP